METTTTSSRNIQTEPRSPDENNVEPNSTTASKSQRRVAAIGFGLTVTAVIFSLQSFPVSAVGLEIVGFLLLIFALLQAGWERRLTKLGRWTLIAIGLLPLLYLVPLPFAFWSAMPGREVFTEALQLAGVPPESWRPLSLVPSQTVDAWFALIPPLGVFVAVLTLETNQVRSLVLLLAGLAAVQSLLAIGQYLRADDMLWAAYDAQFLVTGVYRTRNDLTMLLVMILPIVLGMFAVTLGRAKLRDHYQLSPHGFIAAILLQMAARPVWYLAVVALSLMALVATRLPIAQYLALTAVAIATISFSDRIGGRGVLGTRGKAAFIFGSVITVLLLVLISQTLAVHALGEPGEEYFLTTLAAVVQFFPWGSGSGVFAEVIPGLRSDYAEGILKADSDLLKWLLGGGLIALIVAMMVLASYAQRWLALWQRDSWSTFAALQIGAGIGLFLVMLHGLFDAPLQHSANAVSLAIVAGVFFAPLRESKRRRGRDSVRSDSDDGRRSGSRSSSGKSRRRRRRRHVRD